MGLVHRVTDMFKIKANKALDRAEDPRETLDYAYQRQIQMLQKVKRGLADVTTSRKRIEMQRTQLAGSATRLQSQAEQALGAGREDLAREALTRRAGVLAQDQELKDQLVALQQEEEKLTTASRQLETRVDEFRTRKETVKASYTAAEAQTSINEAATGISDGMGDIGSAVQRAQDKTEQLQARAGALDELMASGALEDPASPVAHDDLRDQLDALTAGGEVEAELAAMKAELTAGKSATPSLEAAPESVTEPAPAKDEQDEQDAQPAKPGEPEAKPDQPS
ncbi:PspA/IM30 family protein [Streptacidiphilus fuscans]|uniref:PspA/IM30 family protein n=1 Tax=Streptacidiphilus fuscans TaxID=2789292 RepID=A0A931FAT6_9ACTN|nr:PspA/IM30 family protein [Streptacidiphilus fuscans]MBF9066738.1 PspA/IM30 family protein [Streptacidiphilus fuscans]